MSSFPTEGDGQNRHPLLQQIEDATYRESVYQDLSSSPLLSETTPDGAVAVILDRRYYGESHLISRLLNLRGVPTIVLNIEDLASASVALDPRKGSLTVNHRRYLPTVVWRRHFDADSTRSPTLDPPVQDFLRSSWHRFAIEICAIGSSTIGGDDPSLTVQQSTATKSGMMVPDTVISSSPAAAVNLGGCDLIVKTLCDHFLEPSAGVRYGSFATKIERSSLTNLPSVSPPCTYQSIATGTEVRLYWLDGVCLGYRVEKPSPDAMWADPSQVAVSPYDVPGWVSNCVMSFMSKLGQLYGAIDAILSGENLYFLEVNLNGDWLWFEGQARKGSSLRRKLESVVKPRKAAPISLAAARMVEKLHSDGLRERGV